jgi:hypothetical protein
MFISPYPFFKNYYRAINPISYVRMLNSSVNSTPVDIYFNDRLIFKNLKYKSFSDYINIIPIEDVIRPKLPNKALIKFVNLFNSTINLDVILSDGKTLFKDVPYTGVSTYKSLQPGTYTIYIAKNKGEKLLTVPQMTLTPNRFYSIYAVGNSTDPLNMQLLIPLDGNSYLKI